MKSLILNNVSKSFQSRKALKNVSFEINEGECVVIGGENGSGKTVLMNIIAGLEEADSGDVKAFSRPGLVFQEAETQILGETVYEDIAFGPKNLGWKKEKIAESVLRVLKITGLSEKKDFPARFLSGGEKRRLAVACMLAMDLSIIIFDEPYANLDYGGVKQVNALIKELKAQGKTIIILTHEIEKCLALSDRFIVLFRGEKVFDGPSREGLLQNLEEWNIRKPLASYNCFEDLVW